MKLIGKRPLCTICLCLIFSGLMGVWMPWEIWPILMLLSLLGTAAAMLAVRLGKLPFYSGCMAICLLVSVPIGFGASSRYYEGVVHRFEDEAGQACIVEGLILERQWSASYAGNFLLRVDTKDGQPCSATFLLECAFPADCQPGDRVRVNGILAAHDLERNGFNQRRYYLAQGIAVRLLAEEHTQIKRIGEASNNLLVTAFRFNTALAARLTLNTGKEAGGLLSALLLGHREALADNVVRDFRRLGVSHLIALSGMHLSLLTGALDWLLRRLRLPRGWRMAALFVGVELYVLLTGAPTSVVRAALMLAITYVTVGLFAETDGMTVLFSAAALICLFNPAVLLDFAFWMSVFAVLAMLVSRNFVLPRLPGYLQWAVRMLVVSFTVNLMTVPFAAMSDGELSMVVLPANLLMIPAMSLLLYCAPFAFIPSVLISRPIALFAEGILLLAEKMAAWRGITVSLQDWRIPLLLLPMLVVWLVLLILPPKKRRWGWLALGMSILLFFGGANWISTPRETEIIYAHISQSEVMVVRHPEGTLLCDLGDGSFTPLRAAAVYASAAGAEEIDTLMLTHYHTRHIGSVQRLVDYTLLRGLLLPVPGDEREREIAADLEEIAQRSGITIGYYPDGLPIRMGELTVTPHTRSMMARSEQPLLLLHVEAGGEAVTYLGASVAESELLTQAEAYAANSRYLIFGDHGPKPRRLSLLANLPRAEKIILASADTVQSLLPADANIPVVAAKRIRFQLDQ